MSSKMQMPAELRTKGTHGVHDDFQWYISPHLWTTTGDVNCTAAITANAEGGVVALTTTATDNDQVMLATTNAVFKARANADIVYVARVQYAESNTTNAYANVAVGFSSDFTTDLLLDSGAGADVNHTGALIYKKDGGTKWICHASNGATQYETTSTTTAGGSDWVELKITCEEQGDGNVRYTFHHNDQPLRDTNGRAIAFNVAHSGSLSVKPGVFVKAGTTAAETVSVDFVAMFQNRDVL